MSFKSFIYLNTKSIKEYTEQISRTKIKNTIPFELAKARASAKFANGSVEADFDKKDSENSSISTIFDNFEKLLGDRINYDYFDALEDCNCDISTIPSMSIFKTSGYGSIPEGFDTLALLKRFAPLLQMDSSIPEGEEDTSVKFALSVLNGANADIPLLIETNEELIATKLKTEYLIETDYENFEELENEELIFLCKLNTHQNDERVVIFNPLRDFLKLNRAIRRSMENMEGLEPVEVDGPVIKAELLAIYH